MLIDQFSSNCLSDFHQRVETLSTDHHLYLLIDGAFLCGSHRPISKQEKRIIFEALPSCNDDTRDVSPFLIRFDKSDCSHCRLLEKCSGWPMLSVIETKETLDQVAARLATWCIVDVDGQSFNFRFADTRRLPSIARVLTPAQTARFIGPAIRWDYVGRDGGWSSLETNPQYGQVESEPTLSASQFGLLVQDSRADELLALLAYRGQKLPGSPSTNFNVMMTAINKVEKLGLSEFEMNEEILSTACAYVCNK